MNSAVPEAPVLFVPVDSEAPAVPTAPEQPATPPVSAAASGINSTHTTPPYPDMARRNGVQGDVLARFIVDAQGAIRDFTIVSTSSALLNRTVQNAITAFRCVGQGRDVAVEVPFAFRLRD